jgi:hypothetical protein
MTGHNMLIQLVVHHKLSGTQMSREVLKIYIVCVTANPSYPPGRYGRNMHAIINIVIVPIRTRCTTIMLAPRFIGAVPSARSYSR